MNKAVLTITNCLHCPYVDYQLTDPDGYTDIYCKQLNEFIGEFKTRWVIKGYTNVSVPDNCPFLNK